MTIAAIYGTAVDTNVIRLPSGQVKHVPIKRVGSNYLPRQIRRARGYLARARRPRNGWLREIALELELARAVCHALQYLLSPPTEAELIAKELDHIAANGVS